MPRLCFGWERDRKCRFGDKCRYQHDQPGRLGAVASKTAHAPSKASSLPPKGTDPDRRMFDKLMKDESANLGTFANALRFVKTLKAMSDADPLDAIWQLVSPRSHGALRIRQITSMIPPLDLIPNIAMVNDIIIPTMKIVSNIAVRSDPITQPQIKVIIQQMTDTPFLLERTSSVLDQERVNDIDTLSMFLFTFVHLCRPVPRDVPILPVLAASLEQQRAKGAPELARSINNDGPGCHVSLSAIENWPGGRHDNDHVEYRDIQIMPTPEEVPAPHAKRRQAEYLPLANGADEFLIDRPEERLLNRCFRLMREDMLSSLRDNLALLSSGEAIKFTAVRVEAVQLMTSARPFIDVSFSTPAAVMKMKEKERREFWSKSKMLAKGSLVVMTRANVPIRFAEVVYRDVDALMGITDADNKKADNKKGRRRSRIGLSCEGFRDWIEIMLDGGAPADVAIMQASDSYFSYEPVLKVLQTLTNVPFAQQLCHAPLPIPEDDKIIRQMASVINSAETLPRTVVVEALADIISINLLSSARRAIAYINGPLDVLDLVDDIADRLRSLKEKESRDEYRHRHPICAVHEVLNPAVTAEMISHRGAVQTLFKLDRAQREAFFMAVDPTAPVVLIQGPPGTGKTMIGVHIARHLLLDPSSRILCVCYTNHQLDQFLEELLDANITSIVRVGGRSNSPRLAGNNLFRVRDRGERPPVPLPTLQRIMVIKQMLSNLADDITDCHDALKTPRSPPFEFLIDYMDSSDAEQFELDNETDFQVVIGAKAARSRKDLFDRWRNGAQAQGHLLHLPLWALSRIDRKLKLQSWEASARAELLVKAVKLMDKFRTLSNEKIMLEDRSHLAELLQARVIGCTATGAAKYASLLQSARCNIVIVEEAGELLEAHVLAFITGAHVAKLIMIGDHQQLRPKIESYKLQVESGNGYDLNRSMFERLILNGFPCVALRSQHRMRPQISTLVRALCYPHLEDGARVLSYPSVTGLQDNVIFCRHTELEDADPSMMGASGGRLQSASKINTHEAAMSVACVVYLLQQGYRHDDIVVITPYLGQLKAI